MYDTTTEEVILSEGGLVTSDHLPVATRTTAPAAAKGAMNSAQGANLHDLQRAMIEKALGETNGNRSRTARLLGVSRSQLYTLLRRYALEK